MYHRGIERILWNGACPKRATGVCWTGDAQRALLSTGAEALSERSPSDPLARDTIHTVVEHYTQ